MSYTTIAAGIVSLLGTIPSIKVVYPYEPKELVQYPAATVSSAEHTTAFSDTAHNKREYHFAVRLYFRADIESDAETVLRTVTDDVLTALASDTTLGGSCDWAIDTAAKWFFQEREVPVRMVELTIAATTRSLRAA